jgi:hypothetical protein
MANVNHRRMSQPLDLHDVLTQHLTSQPPHITSRAESTKHSKLSTISRAESTGHSEAVSGSMKWAIFNGNKRGSSVFLRTWLQQMDIRKCVTPKITRRCEMLLHAPCCHHQLGYWAKQPATVSLPALDNCFIQAMQSLVHHSIDPSGHEEFLSWHYFICAPRLN